MSARRQIGRATFLVALVMMAAGCRGAEPFSLVGFDAGNIFILPGSGGTFGGTGGQIIGGGSGGDDGSGGSIGSSGSGGDNSSGGASGSGGDNGSGGASASDAGAATDVVPLPDALPDLPRDIKMPEGPFTPIDCTPLKPYQPDDRDYGPKTTIYSLRDLRVYRCFDGLESGWCTIGAYEPGLDIGYWRDCWTPIGYCQ